jgi:hypothetical protein
MSVVHVHDGTRITKLIAAAIRNSPTMKNNPYKRSVYTNNENPVARHGAKR